MTFGDYAQLITWIVVCTGTIVGYRYQIAALRRDHENEKKNLWAEIRRLNDKIYNHVDGHGH